MPMAVAFSGSLLTKPRCNQASRARLWTADEMASLRRLAQAGHTDGEIAQRLDKTRAAIQGMRNRLGITAGMSPALRGVLMRLAARRRGS